MVAGDATHKVIRPKGFHCASFDGIDDYILATGLDTTKSFSVWLKLNKLDIGNQLIFTNYLTKIGLGFYYGNNLILIASTTGENKKRMSILPVDFSANQWYNIIVNYDESNVPTCYINGVETSYGTDNWWTESNLPYLRIGRRDTGSFFDGELKDFRIYSRTLSLAEINDLANQKPVSKDLVFYMPLKKDYLDYSGNGNNGTNYGTTLKLSEYELANEIKAIRKTANDTYLLAPLKDGQISLVNIEGAAA